MGFFTLTRRQLSALSILLGLSLFLVLVHTAKQSSWVTLLNDRTDNDVVEIGHVFLVPEVPLTDGTLARTLRHDAIPSSIAIPIYNSWKLGQTDEVGRKGFNTALKQLFSHAKGSLNGLRYAFFLDVDSISISHLEKPTLFFGHIGGQWTIYVNGQVLAEGDNLIRYPTYRIPKSGRVRLTWVIVNKKEDAFNALNFTHGISIRSAKEAAWAQRTLPMQKQLPRLIACLGFLCLALFSAILAWSAPRYNDLWGLAAFCGSMFFVIWVQTPFYWESFVFEGSDGGPRYLTYTFLAQLLITGTGTALSLSFFRIRGYFLWLILGLSTIWAGWLVVEHLPGQNSLNGAKLVAAYNAKAVIALIASQIITFLYGFYSLIEQYLKFKAEGLAAMLRPMRRRLFEATLYTLGMSVMLVAYLRGLPLQSTTAGPDLFLLFALVPAFIVFTQFYWMMGAGTRFREKLVPQFDYVDYLVMEFRDEALKDTYDGVLAAFDLKGFKKLMGLKLKSPAHAESVALFLTRIKTDLDMLITNGRTVFRYKSNGDEWIYTLYAQDKTHAQLLLKDVVHSWQMQGTGLLNQWKTLLGEHLGPHAEVDDAQEVLRALELHVMFCLLQDMTINAEGGIARPDYSCDSLTFLSPAFKHAAHNRVAMYAAEARALFGYYQFKQNSSFLDSISIILLRTV